MLIRGLKWVLVAVIIVIIIGSLCMNCRKSIMPLFLICINFILIFVYWIWDIACNGFYSGRKRNFRILTVLGLIILNAGIFANYLNRFIIDNKDMLQIFFIYLLKKK